jgi:predicted amidohydrolase
MIDEHPDAEAGRGVNVHLEYLRDAALRICREVTPAFVPEYVSDAMQLQRLKALITPAASSSSASSLPAILAARYPASAAGNES